MDEKKLTDDEIVKALECCKQKGGEDTCKYCYTCPASVWDFEEGITECNVDLFQKAINLIHRLQSENESLKKQLKKLQADMKLEVGIRDRENAELQKQVDELTHKCSEIYWFKKYEQVEKDTAKEIYRELIEMEENPCNSREEIYQSVFGKRGVEVE